jgi:hypothetical protein
LIGATSEKRTAAEPVTRSELRRFVHATFEDDPVHWDPEAAADSVFGQVVAPPLFPTHAFRRAPGTPDPLDRLFEDPEWDGNKASAPKGDGELPNWELPFQRHLNGGSEVEFYAYAPLEGVISEQSTYVGIEEKETSKGPMVLTYTDTVYTDQEDQVLLKVRRTHIHR